MTIAVVSGTRPEIIKLYPLIKLFDQKSIDYKFIHTGQHYDYELSLKFIEEFKIRDPDYRIILTRSAVQAQQVSEIMSKVDNIFQRLNPSLVIIQGDTNSAAASALAAVKSNIPIAHLEAGLRCNDWRMQEEHNRRIVDHISDLLFAPTIDSERNLRTEHVRGKTYVVGNTVIDAVDLCLRSNDSNQIIGDNSLNYKNNNGDEDKIQQYIQNGGSTDFVLVTMHRPENVDNPAFLKELLIALSQPEIGHTIFPLHPRTLKKIHEFGLEDYIGHTTKVIAPVGYFDFLFLLKMCRFVITDSGGVQEEITSPYINKHALVLRGSTERPESVRSGHAILCGVQQHYEILRAIRKIATAKPPKNDLRPYGCGNTAEKITEILERENTIS
jgi:UDP-N-acetylglucosamine 2-epimerase (non-hydrolysing)